MKRNETIHIRASDISEALLIRKFKAFASMRNESIKTAFMNLVKNSEMHD